MPTNEREGLLSYLDQVSVATSAGKIPWKAVNPTTFVWEIAGPKNARVNFQRVDRVTNQMVSPGPGRPAVMQPRKESVYVFQVYDLTQPNLPILNVDSSSDAELNAKFNALFELIKSGVTEKTLEFLKSILPE